MHIGSSEFLALIEKHDCYILYELGAPLSRLKGDCISIRGPEGRALFTPPLASRRLPEQVPDASEGISDTSSDTGT